MTITTKRRTLAIAATAATAALLMAGCSANNGSTASGTDTHASITWAYALPTTWDPVTSHTGADVNTLSLAYASLTQLDKNGDVKPALAESWKYNADGTAITFTLRPNLTFSDGTKLDAAAVVAFYQRAKTQADSFQKDVLADLDHATADSDRVVTLHLTQTDYQIPAVVAGRSGAITSPTAAKTDVAKLNTWPVGAGPFKITDFVAESHADFVKNPGYWDAKDVHIAKLQLTTSPDPSTVVAAVQSGSLDVATLPATKIDEAKAAGLTVTVAPSLAVSDASINKNKAPFNNPKVVEAFRYAFDRQEFVNVLTNKTGTVSSQPFPQGVTAFNPEVEKLWSYDPSKAKKLLADAGYKPGQLKIEITVLSTGQQAGELAQAQLKKIGVDSTIKVIPPGSSTWQNDVYIAKNPQLALDGTIGRESPVVNLLATYGPKGIMNVSGPAASPEFLAALDKVRKTPLDDPNYKKVLHDAVSIGVQQSSTDYLYSTPWVIVSNPKLSKLNLLPSQFRWEGVTEQK